MNVVPSFSFADFRTSDIAVTKVFYISYDVFLNIWDLAYVKWDSTGTQFFGVGSWVRTFKLIEL